MTQSLRYLVGVDGGGTGTRAVLCDLQGHRLGRGEAGASSLAQGVEQAWRHVSRAVAAAFEAAGIACDDPSGVALGIGLAGAGHPPWRDGFIAAAPTYGRLVIDSDIRVRVLGALGGDEGLVVAAGTGTFAALQGSDGTIRRCGGWGYPSGDEGGGAWIGLRALRMAQAAMDGRGTVGVLARSVWAVAGDDVLRLRAWTVAAGPSAIAALAPLVFDAAQQGDRPAVDLLQQAADELARHARALDAAPGHLPIVLCGSVGERLAPFWPDDLRSRIVAPKGDACHGALALLRGASGEREASFGERSTA